MLIRATVAAIDFNANVDRMEKRTADGKLMYTAKVRDGCGN